MNYTLTFSWLENQLVQVTVETVFSSPKECWRIPLWRPGRYEAQAFPQNIQDFCATDLNGNSLEWEKLSSHEWQVEGNPGQAYLIQYKYFANQLNAGGSYLQSDFLYINGINLFMYQEGKEGLPCELKLQLPEGFILGGNTLQGSSLSFRDYHHLVDTPFVASKNLTEHHFEVDSLKVCLSFYGGRVPNIEDFQQELTAIIEEQVRLFGDLPIESYTFWFVFTPYRYRHGVEHLDSTVIVFGTEYDMLDRSRYRSFLEICCHEFFHVWNVKAFRPRELNPYNYAKPQYSRLHYITEGITTYYGCFMLFRAGLCSFEEWVGMLNEELLSLALSGGGDYISLTEASFDSWVNGYHRKGAPNRRISFYTKGHLVALLLDYHLRSQSGYEVSLDNVLRDLWAYARQHQGKYVEEDFASLVKKHGLLDYDNFYRKYMRGVEKLTPALNEFAESIGLSMVGKPYPTISESLLGVRMKEESPKGAIIANFLPELTDTQGMMRGDEIIALGGMKVDKNWKELLIHFRGASEVELHIFRMGKLKVLQIAIPNTFEFFYYQFAQQVDPSEEQLRNRMKWRAM